MILAEIVEGKKEALRVEELARILDVSIKKIYRMAAKGQIPSLRISSSIRFDPHDVAVWLRGQSCEESIPAVARPAHKYRRARSTNPHSVRASGIRPRL